MSIKVSELVRRKRFTSFVEKAVARDLADYADDSGGKAFPSVETIMANLQLTRRPIQNALKSLRERGVLKVERQGGGRNLATRYRLDLAVIESLPDSNRLKTEPVRNSAPQAPFKERNSASRARNSAPQAPDSSLSVKKDRQPYLQKLSPPLAHSAPTERGAVAPADVNAQIWKSGLTLLTANGVATERARSILGQWCKRANSPDQKNQLAGAIRRAAEIGTGDPVSYVAAAMNDIAPLPPDPRKLSAKDWRVRARVVIERQEWSTDFGPRPETGRCLMPAEFITPELMAAISPRRAA